MSLSVNEHELLQEYELSSLQPRQWEDIKRQKPSRSKESAFQHHNDWTDPLGLHSTVPTLSSNDANILSKVNITSKAFDAKTFLNTVHPNASYSELSHGAANLKRSMAQGSEALKVLVDQNFDRFVTVKATNDSVFREMSESMGGPFGSAPDEGVEGLRTSVTSANSQADDVFRPVLENYVKSVKLRNTLGVFQRSRFFFNLPGSLHENVEAGHYEAALRDYLKGKYLLENRPSQILPLQNESNTPPTESQLAQQRRIFARVWDAVDEIMYDMQGKLVDILRQPNRSVDEQEKCFEVLLTLDPTTDPVAVFLEAQHNHILSLLRSTFEQQVHAIQQQADPSKACTDLERAKDLHDCLVLVRTSDGAKPSFDKMLGVSHWHLIDTMVSEVCRVTLQSVPTFWRVARDHAEGKFSKEKVILNSPIHKQSKAWALECIELFTKSLTKFFDLQPFQVRANQSLPARQLPAWVPAISCSLSTTNYMNSILSTIAETVRELNSLSIPGTSTQLHALLLDIRFQFTEVHCHLWQHDAKLCHYLENWIPNSQQPSITSYLFSFSVFNRWNAREGFYIADVRTKMSQGTPENEIDAAFIMHLKTTFIHVLHTFLEGIVLAAQSVHDIPELWSLLRPPHDVAGLTARDRDTRILLSVSNLTQLRTHVISAWIKQFEDAYHVSLTLERQELLDVCLRLDNELLSDSVRRKGEDIRDIIRRGILEEGIQWNNCPHPTGVNPFVYQALLRLVQVHAQIRATVPALVSRVITALVEIMADAILHAYSQILAFNTGGMLQATLEIEFVHQTMAYHVSPKAESTLKAVYETISQRYSSSASAQKTNSLQKELESVKHTLITSRKATALAFLCFRRPKSSSASVSPATHVPAKDPIYASTSNRP